MKGLPMGRLNAKEVSKILSNMAKAISRKPMERSVRDREPVLRPPANAIRAIAKLMKKLKVSKKMSSLIMVLNIPTPEKICGVLCVAG